MLANHYIVALDTSALVQLSKDFSNNDSSCRKRARDFIDEFKSKGIHIAFSASLIMEFLRHYNESTARTRFLFLHQLPLIAWIRPYDATWTAGNIVDLHTRELHSFRSNPKGSWAKIIQDVKETLWETGVGSDLFLEYSDWEEMRSEAINRIESERKIASILRMDQWGINNEKIKDLRRMEFRSSKERNEFFPVMLQNMVNQLDKHGDKKLSNKVNIAREFTSDTINRVSSISAGKNDIDALLCSTNVPSHWYTEETTVGELGNLAVFVKQIELFFNNLIPPSRPDYNSIQIDSLPSYTLERRLAAIQREAVRIAGSDLGDACLATLTLYADAVQVDKRTHNNLCLVAKRNDKLKPLMSNYFKVSHYSEILQILNEMILK